MQVTLCDFLRLSEWHFVHVHEKLEQFVINEFAKAERGKIEGESQSPTAGKMIESKGDFPESLH